MGIMDRFSMAGRAALVTGAGKGIGAASALALAEAGADVAITARTASDLDAVGEAVTALGRKVVVHVADMDDVEAAAEFVRVAAESLGRLDAVVNGIGGALPRPFLDTSPGRLEQAFHFNVATAHAVNRAAVPIMLAGDGGSIVNITSSIGRLTGRGYLAYGSAKAALTHYTELAAADLAPRIRVNAVAPGATATAALEIVMSSDELRGAIEGGTPLGRLGTSEEIAAAVLYLASDASAYVTGQVIAVDGGLTHPNMDLGLPDL